MNTRTITRLAAVLVSVSICGLAAGCASSGAKEGYNKASASASAALAKSATQMLNPGFKAEPGSYLDATQVPLSPTDKLPAIFTHLHLVLHTYNTLAGYERWVNAQTNIPVETGLGVNSESGGKKGSSSGNGTGGRTIEISFAGDLYHVLNNIASAFDVSWRYTEGNIVFYRYETKSWDVVADIMKKSANLSMTNTGTTSGSSGGGSGSSGGGGMSGGATLQHGSNSQEVSDSSTFDAWKGLESSVKTLLSAGGKVAANKEAGIITVTDTPAVLRMVGQYLDAVNQNLGRQVSMVVRVYSVDVAKQRYFDLGANILFHNANVSFSTTPTSSVAPPTGVGNFTAGILSGATGNIGSWAGTQIVANALEQIGKTSLVTTASGIVLNNRPFPVQDTTTQTYLAEMQTFGFSQVGTQTTLTPGRVTTGFSMVITPHVLASGRILLAYNISVSSELGIQTIKVGDASTGISEIQAPTTQQRSFMQESIVPPGSTLVLAGLQRDTSEIDNGNGATGVQRNGQHEHRAVVITISVRPVEGA